MKFIKAMTTPMKHLIAGLKFLGFAGSSPSLQLTRLEPDEPEIELPISTSPAPISPIDSHETTGAFSISILSPMDILLAIVDAESLFQIASGMVESN